MPITVLLLCNVREEATNHC